MRKEWRLLFAPGGEEALAFLEEYSVDALITDMRMPIMDGASLAQEFQARQPCSLRIGLSGYSEAEQIISSVIFFHQFWSKPCSCEVITERLKRCFAIGDRLTDPLEHRLAALNYIPILRPTLQSFLEEASKAKPDLPSILGLMKQDLGLYCLVGKLLSTNFLGSPRDFENPSDLQLSVNWLRKMFESLELGLATTENEIDNQPGAFVDAAVELAKSEAVPQKVQRLVKITAQLSQLKSPIRDLLDHLQPEDLGTASAYLAAVWGFPEESVEALLPSTSTDSPIKRYLHQAEAFMASDAGEKPICA